MILFQLLIIIIILTIMSIIIFRTYTRQIENYDARISGISKEQCGTFCTETVNCNAFAHDDNTKKCYLSIKPIFYQPADSIYGPEYDIDQYRCNKIDGIKDIDNVDKEIMRRNMIYNCQKNESDEYNLYKIINDKIDPINKCKSNDLTSNSYRQVKYEDYPIFEIAWPTNRKDLEINKMYNKENNKLSNYTLFKKSNNEYEGEYLFPYQCVKNIPEDICIQTCTEREDCIGIEYNPLLEQINGNFKDVCCLKRTIGESIPRRNKYKNGYYYIKTRPDKLNKDMIYITN